MFFSAMLKLGSPRNISTPSAVAPADSSQISSKSTSAHRVNNKVTGVVHVAHIIGYLV